MHSTLQWSPIILAAFSVYSTNSSWAKGKMSDITLRQCQQITDEWIHEVGVRYYSELSNVAILMEETGELARLFSRYFGDQSFKAGAEPPNQTEALAEEMADVLFVLICLANQTGVDLTRAFQATIAKKTKRDSARHAGNLKLKKPPV